MVSVCKGEGTAGGELLCFGSHRGCRFKAHPASAYKPDVALSLLALSQYFQVLSSSLIMAMDNYSLDGSNVKCLL